MRNYIFKQISNATLGLILIFNILALSVQAQTASYRCFCDTDNFPDGVLGFEITVVNSMPGETWTVDNVINLYTSINPTIILNNGTALDPDPVTPGDYSISGFAIDGEMPFVTLRDDDGEVFDMNMTTCVIPTGEIIGGMSVCVGGNIDLEFDVSTNNLYPNSVMWTANGAATSQQYGVDHLRFRASYDIPGTYLISVEGLSSTSCPIEDNVIITVFDAAQGMEITGPDYLCSGSAADITYIVNNPNGMGLEWTSDVGTVTFVPNMGDPMTGSGTSVDATFPGAGVYTLDIENAGMNGCTIDGVEYVVNVVDVIDTIQILGDTYVCQGDMETYTVSNAGDYLGLVWSINPTTDVTMEPADGIGESVTFTFDGEGDYVITLDGMTTDGCALQSTLDVTVPGDEVGTLACNNSVNVSINNNCILELLPEMILEGEEENNDAYSLVIVDATTGEELIGNMVDEDQIGNEFIVTVIEECGGNSCWGRLTVEDKSIPSIVPFCAQVPIVSTCFDFDSDPSMPAGFPDFGMSSSSIYDADFNNWLVSGFDACNDVILSYEDEVITTDVCADPHVLNRTWTAVDINNGAETSCQVTINVSLLDGSMIQWPNSYDSGLDSDLPGEADTDGYYPSLDACNQNNETVLLTGDKWLEDEFGNPSPLSTGSPQSEAFSCPNLQVIGYKDQVLPVCGSSRKILRQWTVWDACELTDIMHTQIITLMDVAPPICIAPIETQVYTDVHTCGADVEITPPFVTGECDDYTYTIKYKFSNAGIYDPATFTDAGVIYDTDLEKYVITDVDFDTDSIWIQYIVRDACGNVTDDCFTELELLDREQPIPACDLNNVISLNSYGYAFAGPATFDDNSWDNCGIYQTVVQKMDDECECHEAKFDFLHSLGSYNGHTYYLSKEKMNGFKAFGLAEALDGYVAVINDEEENEWLRERVDIYTDESFFIGLSGESIAGLDWMNDDDFDYSNWDVAEPSLQSVVGAKGDYHVVMNEDGSWDVERRNRLDTYYVLELDNSCTWSQKISFCCEDVGQETMVALRVIDWHGNHNLCMVNVRVLEFEDPIITCPSDVNMDCQEDFDADDLSRFGEATATDNCNLKEITETSSGFQSFNCGQGSITRTFTAIDFANNTASCTQRITLAPINQFEFSDIVWPREVTLSDEVCTLEDIDPSRTGVPTWDEENFPCSNITYTHSDLLFLIVDGVCQKLVRTWTVVDWCQNNMIWEETQVIKMINTIPPEINFETCRPQTFSDATPISQCLVQIDGIGAGTNEVAGTCPIDPKWTYTIDYHSDGTIDDSGIGNDASGAYPYGTHEINWTVMDGCGNTDSCVKVITVIDNLPPTPYCHGQIVIPISDPEGVEIWASDLDLGSFDNCPTNPVYFSFAENILVANRLLTCDDLDSSSNIGNLVVDLWVYDNINPSLANKSNCIVSIILQDNSDVCGSGTSNSVSAISGSVRTESLEMIDEVEISIASASMSDNMMSSTGEFAFDNLAMYKDYNVNAFKDDNYLSGVSTLDLVLIQRHILGLQNLDSPYKVIAADINDSETITAIDLIELRKLVLGIYEDLPNNYSWRFVESSFNFVDPQHPFPYNESVNVDNLEKLVNDADFVGVKIGDVNNSVSENLISNDIDARSRDHILNVDVITTITDKGNQRLQFVAKADDQYLGAQFAFSFDAFDSELLAMIPMQMNIANEHVAWDKVDDGHFVVSWNAFESQEINKDDVLFELLFKGNKASVNVDQAVTNFESEIYTLEDKGVQINSIKFNDHSSELFVFNVDQNSPNPFKDQTEIKFTIDKKGPVVLTVTDQTGRLLYREQNEYNAGINSITLKSESLNANGLLYYQIATGSHTVTKKMIVLQ